MMKSQQLVFCIAMALAVGSVNSPVFGQNERWNELRNLPFRENYPTARFDRSPIRRNAVPSGDAGCPVVAAGNDAVGDEEGV